MRVKLLDRLRRSVYVRNVLTLFTGTLLAQVIPVAVSPLLTRLYGPELFGIFALYLGVITMATVAATGRYEMAITLPESERDAFAVFVLAGIIAVGASVLSGIVVAVGGGRINTLLGIAADNSLVYLIPAGILFGAVFQVFRYWTIYRAKFKHLAIAKVTWAGCISGSQLILALVSKQSGLLFGHILGQILAVVALFVTSIRRDLGLWRNVDAQSLARVARGYRKFPIYSLPADVINSMASQLPLVLLGFYFGAAVVGFYALTLRVLAAPIALIGVSVLEVFKERASRDFRETGSCRDIYVKTFKALGLMGVAPFAVLYLIAPDAFQIIFGAQWREAGDYARLLIGLYFLRFVASPLGYVLYIAEQQQVDLVWQVCLLLVTTASIVAGGVVGDPRLSIGLFAASYAGMYVVYLLLSYRFTVRK